MLALAIDGERSLLAQTHAGQNPCDLPRIEGGDPLLARRQLKWPAKERGDHAESRAVRAANGNEMKPANAGGPYEWLRCERGLDFRIADGHRTVQRVSPRMRAGRQALEQARVLRRQSRRRHQRQNVGVVAKEQRLVGILERGERSEHLAKQGLHILGGAEARQ